MNISDFIVSWKEVRGKTYEFLETIPEDRMTWRPHKDLGTFGMQMRHLGVSQTAYIDGIKSGTIYFDNKDYDKTIERDKSKAIDFLKKLDRELIILSRSVRSDKRIEFHDGVYGIKKTTVGTTLEWLLEHETYHQGILTCYGRLAGLGKFRLM